MSIIKTVNSLKERKDKVEEDFDMIKKDMSILKTDNQSIKLSNSKIRKNIEETMEGKLCDALITRIGKEIEKVTRSVTSDLCTVKEDIRKSNSDTDVFFY